MTITFKQRIMGAILVAALLPIIIITGIASYSGYHTARSLAEDGIKGVTDASDKRLEAYMDLIDSQVRNQAGSPLVHEAMKEFISAENSFDPDAVAYDAGKVRARYEYQQQHVSNTTPDQVDSWMPTSKKALALQYLYIAQNTSPIGEKQKLDAASDGSDYSRVHAKYHPVFRRYVEDFKMYDYFLIAAGTGTVVYTNFKEVDFQTSVKEGALASSPFSQVVRKALASHDENAVFLSDILPYMPSYNDSAIFAAAPIVEDGKTIGALAFQLPLDKIKDIFSPLKDLGESADGFLAGADMTFKTSQTSESGKAGEPLSASLQAVIKPLIDGSQKDGIYHYVGEDGEAMSGMFNLINIGEESWVMVVGQDDKELLSSVYKEIYEIMAISVVTLVVMAMFGLMLGGSLVKPVQGLARGFFAGAEKVGRATGQVGEAVSSMVAASEETSAQSKVVRKNSGEASGYVASVSTAVEELNISINDISQSIGETNMLIEDAVTKAQKTDEVVRSLGEASKKITEVVSLINDLAEQTNLLALNAAIEAARAGDAGRGFAVVADEVKKLASHTSQATVDIKEQVKEILAVSEQSVKALHTVVEAIHKIRDNATTVSAAVEEQSGVAKQIAGSVRDAATRVQQVDENMNGIEQAANDTGVAADQVNGSSQEVQGAFDEMKGKVQQVLDNMGIKA